MVLGDGKDDVERLLDRERDGVESRTTDELRELAVLSSDAD